MDVQLCQGLNCESEMEEEIKLFENKARKFNIDWLDVIYVLYPTLIKRFSRKCLEPRILEIDLRKKKCSPDCGIYLNNLKCNNESIIMVKLIDPMINYKHQTLLFVDEKNKTIEYFDSVGDEYGINILRKYLTEEWKILTTLNFCPKISTPQYRTQDKFCASWSLLYIYLRSKYERVSIQNIWNILINSSKEELKNLIYGFIIYVIDIINSWKVDYKIISDIIKNKDDEKMYKYNMSL